MVEMNCRALVAAVWRQAMVRSLALLLAVALSACGSSDPAVGSDGPSVDVRTSPDMSPDLGVGPDLALDLARVDGTLPDALGDGPSDTSPDGPGDGAARDATDDLATRDGGSHDVAWLDAMADIVTADGGSPDAMASDLLSPDAQDATVDALAPTDSGSDTSVCPSGKYFCPALSLCIPNSHCCTTLDCSAPQTCPAAGGVCTCPTTNACSSGDLNSFRCIASQSEKCHKEGACYLWKPEAYCTFGCGLERCKVNIQLVDIDVPCKRPNGKDWDAYNAFGNTEPPDPFVVVAAATETLSNTCGQRTTFTQNDLGTVDPYFSYKIRVIDDDTWPDTDDLMIEYVLKTTVGSHTIFIVGTFGTFGSYTVAR
jgi:hypothetical protein